MVSCYEVLYLFRRRWHIRDCARLNVLYDNTYRFPSGRALILPILPVVTGFQLGRYVILRPSFIFTHLLSPISIFHPLHLHLYIEPISPFWPPKARE
jgi:hypothetical protein